MILLWSVCYIKKCGLYSLCFCQPWAIKEVRQKENQWAQDQSRWVEQHKRECVFTSHAILLYNVYRRVCAEWVLRTVFVCKASRKQSAWSDLWGGTRKEEEDEETQTWNDLRRDAGKRINQRAKESLAEYNARKRKRKKKSRWALRCNNGRIQKWNKWQENPLGLNGEVKMYNIYKSSNLHTVKWVSEDGKYTCSTFKGRH